MVPAPAHIAISQRPCATLPLPCEVVYVDDGSAVRDESSTRCRPIRSTSGGPLSRNFGKEAALMAGSDTRLGAVMSCGDGQHPPDPSRSWAPLDRGRL